ncbi:SsrA-binding protein [Aureliella helgolandensis]|uniref:SsrA-binding protein n=1 Tax=Aureliella helgolandensis TaxID=2527968 RepID=A0A518GEW8_9BACT|nr:SsrA-binding protein [Aureliella helgolandensis]
MNHRAALLRIIGGSAKIGAPMMRLVGSRITLARPATTERKLSKKKAAPTKPKPTKSKGGTKSSGKGTTKGGKTPATPSIKPICTNRKARHKYEILDTIECGMILVGSEVKSLRNGKCQLDESYGRVRGETLWLFGCDIAEYPQATVWNHEPRRPRQLLIHRREMGKFVGQAKEKGLTLVPLQLYFNERGIVKCQMALCKGMKLHDKREKLKKADARRDIERAVRRGR